MSVSKLDVYIVEDLETTMRFKAQWQVENERKKQPWFKRTAEETLSLRRARFPFEQEGEGDSHRRG